jgi:UDP-glucose 4-epimerase
MHHATLAGVHGTFNVAADGVLVMSQVLRRLARTVVPVPRFAMSTVGAAARQARLGLADFNADQLAFLTYGRGLDTTRMRDVLGFTPAYTTEQAVAEFAAALPPRTLPHPVVAAEELLSGALGGPDG